MVNPVLYPVLSYGLLLPVVKSIRTIKLFSHGTSLDCRWNPVFEYAVEHNQQGVVLQRCVWAMG